MCWSIRELQVRWKKHIVDFTIILSSKNWNFLKSFCRRQKNIDLFCFYLVSQDQLENRDRVSRSITSIYIYVVVVDGVFVLCTIHPLSSITWSVWIFKVKWKKRRKIYDKTIGWDREITIERRLKSYSWESRFTNESHVIIIRWYVRLDDVCEQEKGSAQQI